MKIKLQDTLRPQSSLMKDSVLIVVSVLHRAKTMPSVYYMDIW